MHFPRPELSGHPKDGMFFTSMHGFNEKLGGMRIPQSFLRTASRTS